MNEFERVQKRLAQALPELSPTLCRAATYVLENPADVVTMSMREIARASDIPAPNYSRLALRVGFAGYSGLRAVYRRRVHTGRPIVDAAPERTLAASGDGPALQELWAGFKEAVLGNVEAAFENVNCEAIASLAEELHSRDQVYIAAMHASHNLARYLHSLGRMATPSFRLVGLEPVSLGDDLVDMGNRDALICLSSTASDDATIEVAKVGQERGALVICIADRRTTPLAAVSERLLLVPVESPSSIPSNVGVLAIIEMLVAFIVSRSEDAAATRMERIHAERQRFGPR